MFEKNGKKEIFHGRTFEVSASGTSFFSENNIFKGGDVTLLLALPWYRENQKEQIIQIKARVIHTILSSENQKFRTGLQFVHFIDDKEHYLESALHNQPKFN